MADRIVQRHEWEASVPLGPAMPHLPVEEFWLHHQGGSSVSDPLQAMRNIEDTGRQRFGRFSYSYAWHRANGGTLLEGAGLTVGAHTGGRNSRSLAVVLADNFETRPMPDEAVQDVAFLIDWLVRIGALKAGRVYPTGGHRDLKQTACPGINAYNRIDDIRDLVGHTLPPHKDDPDMALSADDKALLERLELRAINLQDILNGKPDYGPDGKFRPSGKATGTLLGRLRDGLASQGERLARIERRQVS